MSRAWIVAFVVFAFHLATATIYGYHRDEFYYLAQGRRLSWGYVDNPPLTPFLYRVSDELFGSSRFALSIIPALLHAGIVVLVAFTAREIGGNNRGPFVRKYLAPAGLDEGDSWCAGFVSWCFMQASGGDKAAMPFTYIASARTLLAEFKQQGWASAPGSGYLPQPGDVVVWWRVSLAGWQGHTGLVHSVQDGMLYTIEGNRSPRVQGFSYVLSRMDKLLGYGHVP